LFKPTAQHIAGIGH